MDWLSVQFSDLSAASCDPWVPKFFLFPSSLSIALRHLQTYASYCQKGIIMPFLSSAHYLNVSVKTFLYPAEIFHFTENLKIRQILLNNPCMCLYYWKDFCFCKYPGKKFRNYWGHLGNQWTQRWDMKHIYCAENSLLSLANYCLYNINSPLSPFVHSCVLGIQWFSEAVQGFTLLWTAWLSRWLGEITVS